MAYIFRNDVHNNSQNQVLNKAYGTDIPQKTKFFQACDLLSFAKQIALGMVSYQCNAV